MAVTIPGPHPVDPPTPATDIIVAADATNGIAAGDLQTALESLAARIKTLEP
jgi:hypothetical protein